MVCGKSKGFGVGFGAADFIVLADFDLEETMTLTVYGKKRYIVEMEEFLSADGIPFSARKPEFWRYSRSSDKVWVTFRLQSFRGVGYLMKKYENRCFLQYHNMVSERPREAAMQLDADFAELQPYEDLESYEARIGGMVNGHI